MLHLLLGREMAWHATLALLSCVKFSHPMWGHCNQSETESTFCTALCVAFDFGEKMAWIATLALLCCAKVLAPTAGHASICICISPRSCVKLLHPMWVKPMSTNAVPHELLKLIIGWEMAGIATLSCVKSLHPMWVKQLCVCAS